MDNKVRLSEYDTYKLIDLLYKHGITALKDYNELDELVTNYHNMVEKSNKDNEKLIDLYDSLSERYENQQHLS